MKINKILIPSIAFFVLSLFGIAYGFLSQNNNIKDGDFRLLETFVMTPDQLTGPIGEFSVVERAVGCESILEQASCISNNCIWLENQSSGSYCKNSNEINCNDIKWYITCDDKNSCGWTSGTNSTGDYCRNYSNLSCNQIMEWEACQKKGCAWTDSQGFGNYCRDINSVSCSDIKEDNSCLNKDGCVWTSQEGSGNYCVTNPCPLTTLPTPTSLSVSGNTVSWSAVTGATGYALRIKDIVDADGEENWGGCADAGDNDFCNDVTGTSKGDFIFKPGHEYKLWIYARKTDQNCSLLSASYGMPTVYKTLCGGTGSTVIPGNMGCNSGETDTAIAGRSNAHCCDPSNYVAPIPTKTCAQMCGGNDWSTTAPVSKANYTCTSVSTHHGEVTDGTQCFCAVCRINSTPTPTPTPHADCYTCSNNQCVFDAGCRMSGPRCTGVGATCPTPTPTPTPQADWHIYDLDNDGDVDIFDFRLFRSDFLSDNLRSDFDNDGDVDIFDFRLFRQAFLVY